MQHEQDIIAKFRDAMAKEGIKVSADIEADGEFHRVHVDGDKPKSRNGWYVLHLDGKPSGAFGCNKRWGNSAKFTWSGETAPLTPEERREFARKMAKQKAEREAAEKVRREAAAIRANQIWDAAAECTEHPYLTRKGVRSQGLRVGVWEVTDKETGSVRTISKRALLIPIRDASKRIHSLQAIFPGKTMGDRDKDYLKDGAKEGLFYSFGKPLTVDVRGEQRMVILIGEGYATVESAHQATGHAGIVAFDAGNLLAVARTLRMRFPEAMLVFLADNDQWTSTPVENPGVHHAKLAAKAVNGVVVIPHFDHADERKPTDVNDLHKLFGAEAVASLINGALNPAPIEEPPAEAPPPWEGEEAQEAQPEVDLAKPLPARPGADDDDDDARPEQNGYFAILGYNRDTYYIFQHGKRQIAEVTTGKMGELGLIELAPLNWWEMHFPGERSKIDTKAAAEFLIRTAEKRGIYDTSRVRGRGAWVDAGRMIYHHGGYLSIDGQPTDITQIESRYVYELDKSLPPPADTAMTSEEGENLLELASMFRWSKPGSAALLAGWVALAPVCGALKWRPHIWLSGGAGCGKSTVLNKYAHLLLGGLDLYAQGSSSEAGIRQTLRADARPVLFDESESNEESDARRIQNVLSLIRQASTESEAQTLKGTAGGSSMAFHIRSMFCLASIQVALKQQADVERLTVLALRSKKDEVGDAAAGWKRLSDALYNVERDETLPSRLFRRSLDLLPITLKNIGVFAHVAAKHFGNQRDGDQYGTLLAGAWSLISTREATTEEATEMIQRYDWSEHRDNAESDEGQRALSALLEAHVRIKGGIEVTVYELICAAFGEPTDIVDLNDKTANALLQRYGMKVRGDRLLLSNNSNELRRLMAGSTFEADYRGVLLRVDGADRNDNKPSKFNGVQTKCISLPIGPIVSDDRNLPAF
jgi:putative DNA primase/helicase